jgi:hypothetical protein
MEMFQNQSSFGIGSSSGLFGNFNSQTTSAENNETDGEELP